MKGRYLRRRSHFRSGHAQFYNPATRQLEDDEEREITCTRYVRLPADKFCDVAQPSREDGILQARDCEGIGVHGWRQTAATNSRKPH